MAKFFLSAESIPSHRHRRYRQIFFFWFSRAGFALGRVRLQDFPLPIRINRIPSETCFFPSFSEEQEAFSAPLCGASSFPLFFFPRVKVFFHFDVSGYCFGKVAVLDLFFFPVNFAFPLSLGKTHLFLKRCRNIRLYSFIARPPNVSSQCLQGEGLIPFSFPRQQYTFSVQSTFSFLPFFFFSSPLAK